MDSIYPKIEPGFVFSEDMNDELVKGFSSNLFGFKNAEDITANPRILKRKYYHSKNITLQHVPVKRSEYKK